MTKILVTGASGFIGYHLVKCLSESGVAVACLVRPQSDRSRIESFDPQFVVGDVMNPESLQRAIRGVDTVYHLAGVTKTLDTSWQEKVNEEGVRNVAAACANCTHPPVLVVASSLAAAGPASGDRLRIESDAAAPVSIYGRSKLAGEQAAREFAARLPTTIVRPPIVLGEGDSDGFRLFQWIATLGVHLVPSFRDFPFSTIHAEDLATALLSAANCGHRLSPSVEDTAGIYFASADEVLTYADWGRLIGEVLGRRRVLVVRCPMAFVWMITGAIQMNSRLRGRPHVLSLDKAREAAAGSWACSPSKLHEETGFAPAKPIRARLEQTVRWYVEQGWLKEPSSLRACRPDDQSTASP